jgi:hypothetical protein
MGERCEYYWEEPNSIRVHFCGKTGTHETHKCRACGETRKADK